MKRIFILALLSSFMMNAQDTIETLHDVTIYGVRSNKTSPVSKCNISRETLQKTSIGQEVSTVLNQTPNVTLSTDNGTPFGYTYFRMRGLDYTKMNMTMNGVPLNDPEDQGLFLSNYPGFIDNIQSMEIQRGVGTSSNGVASFAGSVNFMSPDGTEKYSNVKFTDGSFNSFNLIRTSGTYSSGLSKNKLALYANTSYYETNGYKYGSGGNGRSVFISGGYFGEKNILKFTSFIGNSRNGMAWMGEKESDIAIDPRTNSNRYDGWDNFTQTFLQLEYSKKISSKLSFHSSGFFNALNGGYDWLSFPYGGGNRNLFLNSKFTGIVTNFNYKTEKTKADFGISVNTYDRNHSYAQNFIDAFPGVLIYDNQGSKNEVSSYIKVSQKIDKLFLFADLQYRHVEFNYSPYMFSTIKWDFFNPKAGITYQPRSNTNYYISAAITNREPTRSYLFNNITNPALPPADLYTGVINNDTEHMVDYELGINHFSKLGSLQANLFFMDYSREIAQTGGSQPSGIPNSELVYGSYRSGIELDAKMHLSKYMSFTYSGAYNKSSMHGNQHILLPQFNHNFKVSFSQNGFILELLSKCQTSSYLDTANIYSIPGFVKFDANLGYSEKHSSVMLQFVNLTNKSYFTNGYIIGADKMLFVNTPFTMFLTLNYKF